LISVFENLFRRFAKGKLAELAAGGLLALSVPTVAFLCAYWLINMGNAVNYLLGWALAAFLGYTVIAAKNLYNEPLKVASMLAAGDLDGARKGLSYLVGRDTQNLDEKQIIRALVETVAENTSDGVIAPLFYLAVGGPPLAMAYKAVNTLDSRVGCKNEKDLCFGKASARLDDVVNYIPARISALLMVMSALILRKDWRGAWRMTMRDSGNHPSPNSGYPEAAVAGAIGRRLGGVSYYGGMPSNKPFIGDDKGEFQIGDVKEAGSLMLTSAIVMVFFSVLILAILN